MSSAVFAILASHSREPDAAAAAALRAQMTPDRAFACVGRDSALKLMKLCGAFVYTPSSGPAVAREPRPHSMAAAASLLALLSEPGEGLQALMKSKLAEFTVEVGAAAHARCAGVLSSLRVFMRARLHAKALEACVGAASRAPDEYISRALVALVGELIPSMVPAVRCHPASASRRSPRRRPARTNRQSTRLQTCASRSWCCPCLWG